MGTVTWLNGIDGISTRMTTAQGEKGKTMSDPWDEWTYDDICYECRGYGDDYYLDDEGELVSACSECWVTKEKHNETD